MTNRKKYIDNQNNKQLASLLANENVIEDEDGKGKFLITLIKGNFISRAKEIEEWLSQEAEEEKICGNCKFHKKVKPCIGLIDKMCVNPKSKDCGAYTMSDCSCDMWEAKENSGIDEDTVYIPQIGNMPKTDKTKSSFNVKNIDLEKEIIDLKTRVQELEEFTKIQMDDFWKDHYKATHNIKLSGYSYGSIEKEKTSDEMFEELGYIKEGKFSGCIAYWCDNYKKRITINWNDEYEKATDFEYQKSIGGNSVSDTITEAEDKAIHKKISELKEELKNESN